MVNSLKEKTYDRNIKLFIASNNCFKGNQITKEVTSTILFVCISPLLKKTTIGGCLKECFVKVSLWKSILFSREKNVWKYV
ncbi:hypothetical protein [Bacillus toyonensis]|uniref:hypothetical protein n=1 Tax=Bacillus toyonensis TaxID=155322 RepID=UPI000BEDAB0A|nr:hypothetical protein [Bacillus toyonensis]PEC65032.1 hypothetical protein CON62_23955 [Bacillus toyonensis]